MAPPRYDSSKWGGARAEQAISTNNSKNALKNPRLRRRRSLSGAAVPNLYQVLQDHENMLNQQLSGLEHGPRTTGTEIPQKLSVMPGVHHPATKTGTERRGGDDDDDDASLAQELDDLAAHEHELHQDLEHLECWWRSYADHDHASSLDMMMTPTSADDTLPADNDNDEFDDAVLDRQVAWCVQRWRADRQVGGGGDTSSSLVSSLRVNALLRLMLLHRHHHGSRSNVVPPTLLSLYLQKVVAKTTLPERQPVLLLLGTGCMDFGNVDTAEKERRPTTGS